MTRQKTTLGFLKDKTIGLYYKDFFKNIRTICLIYAYSMPTLRSFPLWGFPQSSVQCSESNGVQVLYSVALGSDQVLQGQLLRSLHSNGMQLWCKSWKGKWKSWSSWKNVKDAKGKGKCDGEKRLSTSSEEKKLSHNENSEVQNLKSSADFLRNLKVAIWKTSISCLWSHVGIRPNTHGLGEILRANVANLACDICSTNLELGTSH